MFIACPDASMTYVSRTPDPAGLLSKLRKWNALEVELVADVAASRGAVSWVQKHLNGRGDHGQWFRGLVTAEEAEALVAEGERDASAPSGGELRAWKYQVSTLVGEVAYLDDDEEARDAWRRADSALRSMAPRLVHDSHVKTLDRLRDELEVAASDRASV